MTLDQFSQLVASACSAETSFDSVNWSPINPTYGHCAVVACAAQDEFGGNILRASLKGTPYKSMKSHMWNVLPDGTECDFTELQFIEGKPTLSGAVVSRATILEYPDTNRRYLEFKSRFKSIQK